MPQQHSLASLVINADVLLPDLYTINMSSGIEKNVPLFTGDDYPGWSVSMESYLMASGVWHVIDDFISDTSKTTSGAPAGAQVRPHLARQGPET